MTRPKQHKLCDVDHNPACTYWDIGTCCSCGAIAIYDDGCPPKNQAPATQKTYDELMQRFCETVAAQIHHECSVYRVTKKDVQEILENNLGSYNLVRKKV